MNEQIRDAARAGVIALAAALPAGGGWWAAGESSPFAGGVAVLLAAVSTLACIQWSRMRRELRRRDGIEQDLRKAKEAAEAANHAKGEFMAKMSHELRTPLTGILGMTDLALATSLTSEQRECLESARACADSLLAAVNDIMDHARIEAGKLSLHETPVNLHDLMLGCVAFASALARPKGLGLGFDYEAPEELWVYADSTRLRQVLTNLLGNAVKFTRQGEVRLQVRTIAAGEDRVELELTVSDTGIGIPPEKLDAIFQPFQQADNSVTRRMGGAGLGLSIVSQLVELMKGRISVASRMGAGSMFRVSAPLRVCRTTAAASVLSSSLRVSCRASN